jgi:hypothetical protein
MKWIKQERFSLLVIFTAGLVIFAYGNSVNSEENISQKKMHEIKKDAIFSDSLEQKQTVKFDFENFDIGKLPPGWLQYYTGSGGTEWKVTNDNGNKVLAQLYSDNPNNHFNIVVNDSIMAKDMVLSVRIKGMGGKHDKGGGLIWRFIDKENYYLVRENPLEDNVVLYKVQNGNRTDLPLIGKGKTYGVRVNKLGNGWNTLKLVVKGDLFKVYLNDKELFKVQDGTFTNAGEVGLWSKSDAVSYFDDFEIDIY